tara:strand:+ start:683 stop:1252 length:570 start_codon:yes stop_codon:yes gene_type:complete
METEIIGFMAQLITGIATLLVALVLVFQLRKQNQQLKIQHQDSDNKITYDSITAMERLTIPENYGDSFVDMMWKARIEGISNMSNQEIWRFQNWLVVAGRRLISEFRLNRFGQAAINRRFYPQQGSTDALERYYSIQVRNLFDYKAALDLYTSFMRPRFSAGIGGQSGLLQIADRTYEEMSGEKIEDNS